MIAATEPGTGDEAPIDVRVVAGAPTDEEVAAITAVLDAAVREKAGMAEPLPAPEERRWQLSHGFLRSAVVPGRGAWRSF